MPTYQLVTFAQRLPVAHLSHFGDKGGGAGHERRYAAGIPTGHSSRVQPLSNLSREVEVHMLTEREQQILAWIRANPSITQKEIAERATISRSSVAVHISNLTRKGAILGRRYVLADKPYVVVIGGTNMDIAGRPTCAPTQHDTMPGHTSFSAGGTARNIAHSLALLGVDVKLITAFGDDSRATELMRHCQHVGIDIEGSMTVAGAATSTHVFITDDKGDMTLAISDMDMLEQLSPQVLASRMELISRAQMVIVDTNLSRESLKYLAHSVGVPLYCDTVSTSKAAKVAELLPYLHTIKPNLLEAQTLTGIAITDDKSLKAAAQSLLDAGVKRVFITMGSRGIYAADAYHVARIPSFATDLVSTTGAGDMLMAGLCWAQLAGENLASTCAAGLATAAVCCETLNTVNDNLTEEEVLLRMADAGYRSVQVPASK